MFYVGVGKEGSKRSKSNSGRNKHWKDIVAKNNGKYDIDILFENLTKEEAINKEIEFVALYGRANIGTGSLVNVLPGGQLQDEGPNRHRTYSQEVKDRMSASHKGNPSNTGKISITNGSISTFISKDSEIPHGWWRGGPKKQKLSLETRRRMSESRKGKSLNLTEEQKQRKSESMKGNKSCQGFIWITNGVESKLLKNENEIPLGWKRGRTKKVA